VADGGTTFTVPPMPAGRDDAPLELPSVPLEMLKTVNVGEVAPDFTLKTLWLIGPDGKVVAKDLRGTAIKQTVEASVK
jgi:hypothetical protein